MRDACDWSSGNLRSSQEASHLHLYLTIYPLPSSITMQTRSSGSRTSSENDTLPASSRAPKTSWEEEEETALLVFLLKRKEKMGDNNAFTLAIFREAARLIGNKMGGKKTAESCRSKWKRVRISFIYISYLLSVS
jgi:hypothetical protein